MQINNYNIKNTYIMKNLFNLLIVSTVLLIFTSCNINNTTEETSVTFVKVKPLSNSVIIVANVPNHVAKTLVKGDTIAVYHIYSEYIRGYVTSYTANMDVLDDEYDDLFKVIVQ